ncbi:MAG: signal peptidase I [Chloroflexi bacterium]|nr:signal peptidase I [Chloroflexota bacterium]
MLGTLLDFLTERRVTIVEESMVPNLRPGDRAVFSRRALRRAGPKRGEIVLVRAPGGGRLDVKRVIGLPGEAIEVRTSGVLVNGRVLVEPYLASRASPARDQALPEEAPPRRAHPSLDGDGNHINASLVSGEDRTARLPPEGEGEPLKPPPPPSESSGRRPEGGDQQSKVPLPLESLSRARRGSGGEGAGESWNLGPEEYFVLSDNRGHPGAVDSRRYGPVKRAQLVGSLVRRF